MRRSKRAGFSLVELLVVIGIIAVLIAILLPTLARAQEASRRVTCLSNLRQVYTAFHFYAQDNHDEVPLGYRTAGAPGTGLKQFNSMVWSSTTKQYVIFGLLYRGGYMKTPRVFFCPSENNPQSMFDTPTNPWPPGSDGNPALQGYCGYGCRPEVELPDDLSTAPPTFSLPTLYKVRNLAILADLTATPERVTTRHNKGINVLYGHGGAHWVDRGAFDGELKQCPTINITANRHQDAIWETLDQQ